MRPERIGFCSPAKTAVRLSVVAACGASEGAGAPPSEGTDGGVWATAGAMPSAKAAAMGKRFMERVMARV